ncbi:protein of unknown function (DUF5009) [Popillia japonica]|uniref:Heparan-alpha-glucosaminide N-acetyltransferase n=1 Tax=Popillia japonica TaxID=7064 RepID=A0AAW1IV31_POPJA
MTQLSIDKAYLITTNYRGSGTFLYSKYRECVNCPFTNEFSSYLPLNRTDIISTGQEKLYKVITEQMDILPSNSSDNTFCDLDTKFGEFGVEQMDILPSNSSDNTFCDLDTKFGEFGVYQLTINDNDCTVKVLKQPVNIYMPILTILIIYSILFILLQLCIYLTRKFAHEETDVNSKSTATKKRRLKSLDTFRGITIALMIFVNYGGGGYRFIEHAVWNGLHIADLVFPWFLWIMGVCIPISIRSAIKSGTSTINVLLRITRRSITLFAIGLFLGAGSELTTMRIFGVLQRFAVSYFFVASICFLTMKYLGTKAENEELTDTKKLVYRILTTKIIWLITVILIAVHTVILFTIPFEDCPSGYLGPGGYHDNGDYFNCTGGITGYIDRKILGLSHMYQYPEIRSIYNTPFSFDPEGVLGCLPSIVHVFIGVEAGTILMTFKDHSSRLKRWIIWAAFFGIAGGALCGFSKENGAIPLNKHLWSLSFILVTSSFALILLCVCYILIDMRKYWSGKPFFYAGMNAITLYIGHSITYSRFPIRWQWNGNETHFLFLLENVWATSVWILISYFLYRKKLFLTI